MSSINLNINRLKSEYYLNKAIKEVIVLCETYKDAQKFILEDDKYDFEWDLIDGKFYDKINNIEKDIAKSTYSVKTSDQAIEYLNKLLKKIVALPDSIKNRLVKSALASMLTFMTVQSIFNFSNKVEASNIPDKKLVTTVIDNKLSSIENRKTELKKLENKITTPRTYSNKLVNAIIKHEGKSLTSYDSKDGAYTIGYGHAVFKDISRGDNSSKYPFLKSYKEYEEMKSRGKDIVITDEQAEQLFKDDLNTASDALNRLLDEWKSKGINPKITQPMYDAMVSMIYNMGIGTFRKSEFIQLVKRGEFKKAAEAIKTTSSHMFDTQKGLIGRRNTESEIFNGNYPT